MIVPNALLIFRFIVCCQWVGLGANPSVLNLGPFDRKEFPLNALFCVLGFRALVGVTWVWRQIPVAIYLS